MASAVTVTKTQAAEGGRRGKNKSVREAVDTVLTRMTEKMVSLRELVCWIRCVL